LGRIDPVSAFSNPTASENCDANVLLTHVDVTNQLACGKSVTRTWTATDCSSNHVSKSQTISQVDTTDPVINGVGADGTVQCPVDPVTAFSNPTASDTCDANVSLTHVDVTNQLVRGKSVTRTWTATDCSSNHVSKSQTISQVDPTDPLINREWADGTVQCPID